MTPNPTLHKMVNDASAATLTESELFAEFLETNIVQFNTRGKELCRFTANELFESQFDYCEIDFHISSALDDEHPTDHLEEVENALLGALANIQLGRKAFEDFKGERLIDEDSAVERFTIKAGEAA